MDPITRAEREHVAFEIDFYDGFQLILDISPHIKQIHNGYAADTPPCMC